MAMARSLYPAIEPINPDVKDTKGNIKYWRLIGIPWTRLISHDHISPSSPLCLFRSAFELQNNKWHLTAVLDFVGDGRTSLTIRVYNISFKIVPSDEFNMIIGIVGGSGEVAEKKARSLDNRCFEVFRLIDFEKLKSILQSSEPYFLFVEIERKDVGKEQKTKEKETKACVSERFMNALRICNGKFPDTASSNAPLPTNTTSGLFPSIPTSSATKETSYVIPRYPSLSKSTPSLPARSPSPVFSTNHDHLFEYGKFDPAVDMGYRSESRLSQLVAKIENYLDPPGFPLPSASKETFPHLHPSLSKSHASLPVGAPTPSLRTNHDHLFEYGKFDPAVDMGYRSESRLSQLVAKIENYLDPPGFPLPSASKETFPHLHPSLSKSHASLPVGAPTPSLRTNYATFECGDLDPAERLRRAMEFSLQPEMPRIENYMKNYPHPAGFSMPSASKGTSAPLNPSFSKSSPSLSARAPTPSLRTRRDHGTPEYMFPSIPITPAFKVIAPPLNSSFSKSPKFLPAGAPTASLLTTNKKFQMDYRDLFLSGRDSDFIINVRGRKIQTHMLILGSRSPVFLAMTDSEVKINDVDPNIFQEFLLYLYTGDEAYIDWKNIAELYKLGDKYCVEDLKELCVERMKTNISMKNFFEIFMLSQQPNHAELSEVTIQFFLENSKQIIESDRYIAFMKDYPDEAYVLIKATAANK